MAESSRFLEELWRAIALHSCILLLDSASIVVGSVRRTSRGLRYGPDQLESALRRKPGMVFVIRYCGYRVDTLRFPCLRPACNRSCLHRKHYGKPSDGAWAWSLHRSPGGHANS